MASCFEIYPITTTVRNADGTILSSRQSLDSLFDPEIPEFLDGLLKPYGDNPTQLFWRLNTTFRQLNFLPWAMIFFERQYELAGHVCASRSSPEDVRFSAYSLYPDRERGSDTSPLDDVLEHVDPVPPVSMLFFRSKEVVSELATRSPLFLSCWSALADKPSSRAWLCVPDPPPEDWVKKAEAEDAALFWSFDHHAP